MCLWYFSFTFSLGLTFFRITNGEKKEFKQLAKDTQLHEWWLWDWNPEHSVHKTSPSSCPHLTMAAARVITSKCHSAPYLAMVSHPLRVTSLFTIVYMAPYLLRRVQSAYLEEIRNAERQTPLQSHWIWIHTSITSPGQCMHIKARERLPHY